MKRILIVAISLFIVISFTVFAFTVPVFPSGIENEFVYPPNELGITDLKGEMPINAARCATVIDAESGNILFSHNAHERRGMASTTKIMTALVAIENQPPEAEFVIPKEAVGIEGSSVYLKEGESLTLNELLYCLLLESGNDAATAVAIFVGKTESGFVAMMNKKAKELGLNDTNFTNPHGLSDENHYTTAHDLAVITACAMKNKLFREIVATKRASVRYDGIENGRRLVNHNKLLFGYSGAIGVKTGYTKRDGKCLVSAAEKDGMRIIAVTLQDAFPTSTHKALLDHAFSTHEIKTLASVGQLNSVLPIKNGEKQLLTVANDKTAKILLPKNADISCEVFLPQTLYAPIEKGETIGYALFRADGSDVYIINIKSTEDIKEKKKTLTEKLFGE